MSDIDIFQLSEQRINYVKFGFQLASN
jgi:hypothetical protein